MPANLASESALGPAGDADYWTGGSDVRYPVDDGLAKRVCTSTWLVVVKPLVENHATALL